MNWLQKIIRGEEITDIETFGSKIRTELELENKDLRQENQKLRSKLFMNTKTSPWWNHPNRKEHVAAYRIFLKDCDFKKGDLVRIAREPISEEYGWPCCNSVPLVNFVGKTFKVLYVDNYGVVIHTKLGNLAYPPFVLEHVQKVGENETR